MLGRIVELVGEEEIGVAVEGVKKMGQELSLQGVSMRVVEAWWLLLLLLRGRQDADPGLMMVVSPISWRMKNGARGKRGARRERRSGILGVRMIVGVDGAFPAAERMEGHAEGGGGVGLARSVEETGNWGAADSGAHRSR